MCLCAPFIEKNSLQPAVDFFYSWLSTAEFFYSWLFFTFDREPGVRRLIGREVLTRVVEGEERVADAADQLGLVGNLPRVEAAQVVHEQRHEALGERVVDGLDRSGRNDCASDALKRLDQRARHLQERLLQLAHGLEDMGRPAGYHVRSEKHAHVDGSGALPPAGTPWR